MTDFRDAQPTGTRIGTFVLQGALGQGGEGIVYRARHDRLGDVLVKEYWPSQIASRAAKGQGVQASRTAWQDDLRRGSARFQRLGERLKALRHRNVVAVHDVVAEGNSVYLVMEEVEGTPLETVLAAGGFVDPDQVRTLARQLADALGFLEGEQLLHRDLSPDNVIITPGHDWRAVLIDFNAAKDLVARLTHSHEAMVKAGYSPIEQYDSQEDASVGPWTDIYGAAAVLYRVIVGRPPAEAARRLYRADQHRALKALAPPGYSAAFLQAIDHALQPLPADRPQSAGEWAALLEAADPVAVAPIGYPPPETPAAQPPAEPIQTPGSVLRRHGKTLAAVIIVSAVVLAWLVATYIGLNRPAPEPVVAPATPAIDPVVEAPSPLPAPAPAVKQEDSRNEAPAEDRVEIVPPPRPQVVERNETPVVSRPQAREYVVYFDYDSVAVTSEGRSVLSSVVNFWRANGGTQNIRIVGHASNVENDEGSSPSYLIGVSNRRANAVVQALQAEGVPSGRLSSNGVGASQARSPGRDPLDRRVVITIQ